jgi:hypothetical protein
MLMVTDSALTLSLFAGSALAGLDDGAVFDGAALAGVES